MSPDVPREATDRQLADMVNFLARLCLEAERGLRPPSQLERFMDPSIALRFDAFVTLGRFHGGPVQPSDLGQAHVARQPDGSVLASIVTRTEERRWGALCFRLQPREQGLWRVADARRLLANSQRAIGQASRPEDRARAWGARRSR